MQLRDILDLVAALPKRFRRPRQIDQAQFARSGAENVREIQVAVSVSGVMEPSDVAGELCDEGAAVPQGRGRGGGLKATREPALQGI